MTQTIEAVYEGGLFRPLDPASLNIPNGQRVQMVVIRNDEDPLKEITSVLDGLSPEEIEEFERIALDRSSFFGPRGD